MLNQSQSIHLSRRWSNICTCNLSRWPYVQWQSQCQVIVGPWWTLFSIWYVFARTAHIMFGCNFFYTTLGVFLSHCRYILKCLFNTGLDNCIPNIVPIELGLFFKIDMLAPLVDQTYYCCVVERLLHVTHTWYDIAFAIGMCISSFYDQTPSSSPEYCNHSFFDISSILHIFVWSCQGRMLCHMVTSIVIIRQIWMKENPPLIMSSPLKLHLLLGKVSFKMKLFNLVLK